MNETSTPASSFEHSHSFLGAGHEKSESKTWAVIWLCGIMMIAEIVGGLLFGSIALVADGLHMSSHAGALLLAALAYTYSRKHVDDARFSFGTGKLGDLAGFTSAPEMPPDGPAFFCRLPIDANGDYICRMHRLTLHLISPVGGAVGPDQTS